MRNSGRSPVPVVPKDEAPAARVVLGPMVPGPKETALPAVAPKEPMSVRKALPRAMAIVVPKAAVVVPKAPVPARKHVPPVVDLKVVKKARPVAATVLRKVVADLAKEARPRVEKMDLPPVSPVRSEFRLA